MSLARSGLPCLRNFRSHCRERFRRVNLKMVPAEDVGVEVKTRLAQLAIASKSLAPLQLVKWRVNADPEDV